MKPKAITLNRTEGYLEITWMDDLVCRYPLPQLREACPCVQCRGGHEFMGSEHDPKDLLTLTLTPARSYRMEALQQVGSYAIQPIWDDGHDSGLYTWDYLRRLCPEKS